ncbi:MAG: dioxygenase [Burkholderiales bacterium]|jgi:4,5-DOPA dioxygenase extradiol|nr:MAG: dioxygenase [Burkholderiales bacterium]
MTSHLDSRLPTLFLSHGSPMIAIEPGEAGLFMQKLGPTLDRLWGRPKAVVIMSPHTATRSTYVLGAAQHGTIHDFGGFPAPLYEIQYEAKGDAALAQTVTRLLTDARLPAQLTPQGGLDHGTWTVLMHMYPQVDVPVVPVSLTPHMRPADKLAMGRALRSLAHQGVLVIGSGSLTHNLQRFFGRPVPVDAPEESDCAAFRAWVMQHSTSADWPALLDYRSKAPYAREMHPTDEHWLPFYFAAGAATSDEEQAPAQAVRLHGSITHGHLAMDAYGFGPGAAALLEALSPA